MIGIIVVLALAGVGVYETVKGTFGVVAQAYANKEIAAAKAEAAKLKVDIAAELSKVEASTVAEVKTLVADVKKYL